MSSPLSFDLNSCLVVLAFGTFLCVADRLISALCFLLFIAISHRFGQGMNMKQILCLCSILEWIDMNDNLMVDDIRWLQHNDLFGKSGSQEKNTFNMSNRFQVLTFSTFFVPRTFGPYHKPFVSLQYSSIVPHQRFLWETWWQWRVWRCLCECNDYSMHFCRLICRACWFEHLERMFVYFCHARIKLEDAKEFRCRSAIFFRKFCTSFPQGWIVLQRSAPIFMATWAVTL